jgi:hypothetical protein
MKLASSARFPAIPNFMPFAGAPADSAQTAMMTMARPGPTAVFMRLALAIIPVSTQP